MKLASTLPSVKKVNVVKWIRRRLEDDGCIVRTIVEILQPYAGRVYDPCCGSGSMFVQSAKFIQNHQKNINNISVYGQEANPSTWKMAHK